MVKDTPQTRLAMDLGIRWGIGNVKAVLAWLKARDISKVTDLMRYGEKHSEAMDAALTDFWEFST